MSKNADTFLHSNPGLYQIFKSDPNLNMAKRVHELLIWGQASGTILDVGCGLGNEAGYLTDQGYKVIGIDKSLAMISWAKEHHINTVFCAADQTSFQFDCFFAAIYSVGSSFLYNISNEEAICTLQNFRKHLKKDGMLYLDIRKGMFFFTPEGQRWLAEELVRSVVYRGRSVQLRTQFSLEWNHQLLLRDYCWLIDGEFHQCEHLKHRLFFPKEIELLLSISGFKMLKVFGIPAPSSSGFLSENNQLFEGPLTNPRMQVIAVAA